MMLSILTRNRGQTVRQLTVGWVELDDELRLTLAVYRVIRMTTTLLYEPRWGGDWVDSYRSTIEGDLELLGRL